MPDASAALDYLNTYRTRGWRPIPLHHVIDHGGCSCGERYCSSPGKHPLFAGWRKPVIYNAVWLDWWAAHPAAGVGLIAGYEFWVLDVDPKNGGDVALAELQEKYGDLPLTYRVNTPSGGYHLYFLVPDGCVITNARGGLPVGLDVRGRGGQVAAPPSVGYHHDWTSGPNGELVLAPEWLLELIMPIPVAPVAPVEAPAELSSWDGSPLDNWLTAVLDDEIQTVMDASEGGRNAALNEAVFSCSTVIGLPGVDEEWEERVRGAFVDVGQVVGLPPAEVRATVASGIAGGKRKPRLSWPPAEMVSKGENLEISAESQKSGRKARGGGEGELVDIVGGPAKTGDVDKDGNIYVNVSNAADAAVWFRNELGRRGLACVFVRHGVLVHTPRVGEEGYREPLEEGDDDGPAQVAELSEKHLRGRIEVRYRTGVNKVAAGMVDGVVVPAKGWVNRMLPPAVAGHVWTCGQIGEGVPNLKRLVGVTHTPVLRRDGSVLDVPGYDPASRLLYLPDRGFEARAVPELPTPAQVEAAVALIMEPIAQFPFVDDAGRAAWVGMAFTPLLRPMLPGPYLLGVIEAPSPGSGKSFLAGMLRVLHGGVLRAELPEDAGEMRKAITTTLADTTAPVVTWDNVRGVVRSSVLEGLLTTGMWSDRMLGTNSNVTLVNDRLWTFTSNNAVIGGDLSRRCLWVTI